MSAERDVNRIVRSWLEEGRTALPDRVLDAVLDELPATPQRRLSWPARRFERMSRTARLVAALAAVLVLAVVGITLTLRSGGNVGGQRPSGSVSISASGPTSPTPLLEGSAPGSDLPPGTYLVDQPFPVRATFTVPAGWTPYTVDSRTAGILVNHGKPPNGSGWGMFFLAGPHFPLDPCHPATGTIPASQVSSAADIVAALGRWPGIVSATTPATVGDRPATLLTLTAPADLSTCTDGSASIWETVDGTGYGMAPRQQVKLLVVDVEGVPIAVLSTDYPQSSTWEDSQPGATPNPTAHAADQSELRAIVESIRLERTRIPPSAASRSSSPATLGPSPAGSGS